MNCFDLISRGNNKPLEQRFNKEELSELPSRKRNSA